MYVNFVNKTTTTTFYDLHIGDLFVANDDALIKVESFHLFGDSVLYNAINMEDGSPVVMFEDEQVIIPTEAELKICV